MSGGVSETQGVLPENWLEHVSWDAAGLVPAIAQDHMTGEVLMFAWMNRESLALTAQTGQVVYWSRSRQQLWRKGEESGHIQKLHEIRLDCDEDVVLLKIEQVGGIACHTGRRHCFFQKLESSDGAHAWKITDAVIKDPAKIYRNPK
jgi:phosphoribosyl-AMP cyclohydrolase